MDLLPDLPNCNLPWYTINIARSRDRPVQETLFSLEEYGPVLPRWSIWWRRKDNAYPPTLTQAWHLHGLYYNLATKKLAQQTVAHLKRHFKEKDWEIRRIQ
jgi:hypothetical protein